MSSSNVLNTTTAKVGADPNSFRAEPEKLRECVAEVCIGLQLLAYSGPEGRAARCQELESQIEILMRSPAAARSSHAARHCLALANFLKALCKHPEDITEANLRTVSSAAGVLDALFRGLGAAQEPRSSPFTAVLLDGKTASRQKVSGALAAAGFEVVPFAGPVQLLQHLESCETDLVVLNIPVPVPEGFDVSTKIPKLALHEKTPILVSISTTPAGAASEFLLIAEIVLKALTLAHKHRMSAASAVVVPLTSAEGPIPSDVLNHSLYSKSTEPALAALPAGTLTEEALRISLLKEAEEREQLARKLQEVLAEKAKLELELQALTNREQTNSREQASRLAQLKRQLAEQQHANEELSNTLCLEQRAAAEFSHRVEQLEEQLRECGAELETLKDHGGRETPQLGQARAELEQAKAQINQQENERQGLQKEHQDLVDAKNRLAHELQNARENEAAARLQAGELERRVLEAVASEARTTADLQKERSERQGAEVRASSAVTRLQQLHEQLGHQLELERENQNRISELEQALQSNEEALACAMLDLEKERSDRTAAEEELQAAGELGRRLDANSSLLEKTKETFARTLEDMEKRLEGAQTALRQNESKLQDETNERRRLQEALIAADRKLQEQTDNTRLEQAKLETARRLEEFERKRLETELVRARHATMRSLHATGARLNTLREQVRQPAKEVRQAVSSLLQSELPEEHKKVVESILEKTLLLERSVQGNPNGDGNVASAFSDTESAGTIPPASVPARA